jgi:hypothetical protein
MVASSIAAKAILGRRKLSAELYLTVPNGTSRNFQIGPLGFEAVDATDAYQPFEFLLHSLRPAGAASWLRSRVGHRCEWRPWGGGGERQCAAQIRVTWEPATRCKLHVPWNQGEVAMGIFSSIMEKIFHAPEASAAPAPAAAAPSAAAQPATGSPAPTVDVVDVLTKKATQKGGGGNWQTSIVDLLKLLDLDSSLTARKELADELNVHVGADGTAEQNIALHHGVMQKLAENGGNVPDSMKA